VVKCCNRNRHQRSAIKPGFFEKAGLPLCIAGLLKKVGASLKTIPVFYCPEMSVDSGGYSPSASKPQQVAADWNSIGIAIDIRSFLPATADELSGVNDPNHVLSILEGNTQNGHGNRIEEVSQSCLWTVGSFVAAAKEAISNGRVACSPTSGFHHAGYDYCGGFCTFNGLMVAAHKMIANDVAVAIVDCDRHFGDGTQDIIERLNLEDRVPHWTYGRDVPSGFHRSDFEQQIRRFITDFAEQSTPGGRVLLYQAGADVHVNDPLGPGPTKGMTNDDMRQRDRLIFTLCRDLKIPVVWNLAGGYQRDQNGGISKVLELHRATKEECLRCFAAARTLVEA
jgi:acetoin utilization deacetylase AcuC-like enzyme